MAARNAERASNRSKAAKLRAEQEAYEQRMVREDRELQVRLRREFYERRGS